MNHPTAHEDIPPPEGSEPDGGDRNAKLKLVAAVSAVSAIILAVWVVLLPYQLADMRLPDTTAPSWEEMKSEADSDMAEFRAALDAMRQRIRQANQSVDSDLELEQQRRTLDTSNFEALKAKLEAARAAAETEHAQEEDQKGQEE
ncbi:hypothetical protein AMJ57_01230 [Parcubacteria bacterium SG8_24]|nr:MAG: hypothetical protein AMJ57_01230 [Parcubacteria bacterium SG8_24]